MEHLYSLPPLEKALIIKRPSAHIKSPYVADIEIDGKMYLGHAPSLGCCGLAEAGSYVNVIKTTGTKCDYRIQQSVKKDDDGTEITIGIAPKLAEKLIESALEKNIIEGLDVGEFGREKKRLNSRFDFIGKTKENKEFILEVKNVPLADYEDIEAKERKKRDYTGWNCKEKVAYFPDGYRKKKTQTVSERALKHVNELNKLKNTSRIKMYINVCYSKNRCYKIPAIYNRPYLQRSNKTGSQRWC